MADCPKMDRRHSFHARTEWLGFHKTTQHTVFGEQKTDLNSRDYTLKSHNYLSVQRNALLFFQSTPNVSKPQIKYRKDYARMIVDD